MASRAGGAWARRRPTAGLALVAALLLPAGSTCLASAELSAAKLCRKAFNVQGRTYALKRMGLVLACVDKLLKCELLAEIDGAAAAGCRAAVAKSCARRVGAQADSSLAKAALRFESKVGVACQTPDYDYTDVSSTGPGGLWFANDATCGASIDLPSLLVCVRDQVEARIDAMMSAVKPRTALLFDNVGLGADFPHLVRPPLVDAVLSAPAPGSGVLVDPGVLVVAAGSGLRFTGDAATLGCGGVSDDGRVTITVGAGPTAQQLTLDEPYGAGEVAIFGPWIAAGSVPYTIALQDGACADTVSGTVSVP